MLKVESQKQINKDIFNAISRDKNLLENLRKDISKLKNEVKRIRERTVTAIALVGTDGGNNKFNFDPFMLQVLRVVDSSNNELFLKVVTSETNIDILSKSHFNDKGQPVDPLGELMFDLGVRTLGELSHMLKTDEEGKATNTGWVNDYREMIEWSVLYKLVTKKDYGTDTLIIFDGLFRTKVFWPKIFKKIISRIKEALENHSKKSNRKIFLAGIAKHTQVLTRYRLAMVLENVLNTQYPAYVEIPPSLEEKVYIYDEWRSVSEEERSKGITHDFCAGNMFLVKFGRKPYDPIWAVDIFMYQKDDAEKIIGYLLSDSNNGFPVPYYPKALQEAHNNAALIDFDYDILQGYIYDAIRNILGDRRDVIDVFQLVDGDPSAKRYQ